eukprot:2486426-Pyramimonas_sp.AAC.1
MPLTRTPAFIATWRDAGHHQAEAVAGLFGGQDRAGRGLKETEFAPDLFQPVILRNGLLAGIPVRSAQDYHPYYPPVGWLHHRNLVNFILPTWTLPGTDCSYWIYYLSPIAHTRKSDIRVEKRAISFSCVSCSIEFQTLLPVLRSGGETRRCEVNGTRKTGCGGCLCSIPAICSVTRNGK